MAGSDREARSPRLYGVIWTPHNDLPPPELSAPGAAVGVHMGPPILVELTEAHRDAFLDYMNDFRCAAESEYVDESITPATFTTFVDRLRRESAGIDLNPGYVPATTWFLWDGHRILGRVSLRHRLTPNLEDFGGHIGYDVRPSARGRGYGTLILALVLPKARNLGLPRVLVTCDPANTPSEGVVLRNGGQLASESPAATRGNRPTRRFWISTIASVDTKSNEKRQ